MADWIIHHEGAFNIWNTVVDAPRFVSAITRHQLCDVIAEEHGRYGMEQLPHRLARVLATGCSSVVGHTLDDCIAVNRAGPKEARLSREEFIRQYLTLPPTAGVAPAAPCDTASLPFDCFTVNFVRLAGLDKNKARECEAIVRQVLDARGVPAVDGGQQ